MFIYFTVILPVFSCFFFFFGLIIPLKLNTTFIFPMVLEKLIFCHIFLHPGLTIPPNFFFSCRKRKVLQDSHSTGNIPQHLLTTKAECNFCIPVVFSCIILGTYIYLTVIRIMRISPCCEYFYSFLTVYRQCSHCLYHRFGHCVFCSWHHLSQPSVRNSALTCFLESFWSEQKQVNFG